PPAEELGREMRESGTHAYGVSFLLTQVPIDVLSLHLQRLRKVFAGQKRYYLRYADGRAFSDLWGVLDQGQRTAMLGPVEAWKAHPSREPFQRGTKWDTELFSHEDGLPLRLSTQQFSVLSHAQLDTQRWSTWLKAQPALATGYALEELQDLSRRTGAWLRAQRDVLSPHLVHAVGVAVLRSGGGVLDQAGFASAVRQGIENDDRKPIDAWLLEGRASDHAAGSHV